jgi:glycosyltransferase involved in cell wall biosynthesis
VKLAVLIGAGLPNPTTGGGALTAYTTTCWLLEQGHDVTVVAVLDPSYADPTGSEARARIEHLESLGARVIALRSRSGAAPAAGGRLRRLWRPRDEEVFPYLRDAAQAREAVADVAPDVVFVYHFEGLAASRDVETPRFAGVGDPTHLPPRFHWRLARKRPNLDTLRRLNNLQVVLRHHPRLERDLLNACAGCGAFAAHHAEDLRRIGVRGCEYLRTPVPDPVGETWRARRDAHERKERPTVLLVGHMRGAVTVDGLRVFVREVLPRLEDALGGDGFEVRIVGGYDPPADVGAGLDRPPVVRLGHLEQPDEEFEAADVLVVPTSIPLGVRVRVITGFSFGSCIVTHASNALGIPELSHERNALIGRTGAELAEGVLRVFRDRELKRRLEEGARETYERAFAPNVAAARIEQRLSEISGARTAAAPASRGATGSAP